MKAPFFVYAHQINWDTTLLTDRILTINQLENYLKENTEDLLRLFVFRLSGRVEQANIHVQNLPLGRTVSSPAEAHQGQVNYTLQDKQVEIIGFYSTEHHGIFTHHDTNMHLHLITSDRKQMGHLDSLVIGPGTMRLFLPRD